MTWSSGSHLAKPLQVVLYINVLNGIRALSPQFTRESNLSFTFFLDMPSTYSVLQIMSYCSSGLFDEPELVNSL